MKDTKDLRSIECVIDKEYPTTQNVNAVINFKDKVAGLKNITMFGEEEEIFFNINEVSRKVAFSENGVYEFTFTSVDGSKFTENITISNIDKSTPYITYSLSDVSPTNKDVVGTIVFNNDGVAIKSIKLNDQEEEILSGDNNKETREFIFEDNGDYTFEVENLAGTRTVQNVKISNIDKKVPTIDIFLSESYYTNTNVMGVVVYKDSGIGLKSAKMRGREAEDITKDIFNTTKYYLFEENGEYVFEVEDLAGNKFSESIVVDTIDKVKPTIKYELSETIPTKKPVLAKLLFEDDYSGIKTIKLHDKTTETIMGAPKSIEKEFRFMENGEYVFEVEDLAGNKHMEIISIENIDMKVPNMTYSLSTMAKTNSSVIGDITFTDEGLGISKISMNGEVELLDIPVTDLSKQFIFEENGEYEFEVEDLAGNSFYETITISNIDKTKSIEENEGQPLIKCSLSNTKLTCDDVIGGLVVTGISSGIKTLKMNNQVICDNLDFTTNLQEEVTFEENGVYVFEVEDNNGEKYSHEVSISNIDKSKPTIRYQLLDPSEEQDEIKMLITFEDQTCGITKITLNGEAHNIKGTPNSIEKEFIFKVNGIYLFEVEDAAGNTDILIIPINNIKATKSNIEIKLDNTNPTRSNVSGLVKFTDSWLGIKSIKLPNGEERRMKKDTKSYSEKYIFDKNGVYEFSITDLAGNETKSEVEIKNIDKIYPDIEIELNNYEYTKEDVVGKIKFTDEGLGIKAVRLYKQDKEEISGAPLELEREYTFTQNGKYKFEVEDLAGNKFSKIIDITNIDKTMPTITCDVNLVDRTNNDVMGIVTFKDDESSIKSIQFPGEKKQELGHGTNLITRKFCFVKNGSYEFNVEDYAGNKYKKVVEITNIDKEAPTVKCELSSSAPTNKDVKGIVRFKDDGFGIKSIKCHDLYEEIENEPNEVTREFAFTENGDYIFESEDVVGNKKQTIVTISNIDKVAPEIRCSVENTEVTNKDVDIEINVKDTGLGIKSITMGNQKEELSSNLNEINETFTAKSNGEYEFIAEDLAGNISTQRVVISNIDKSTPNISVNVKGSEPTNKDVEAKVIFSNEISAIKSISLNGNEEVLSDKVNKLERDFLFKSNGVYEFKATNESETTCVEKVEITNIDKEAPIIEHSFNKIEYTNKDVLCTLKVKDFGVGIKSIKFDDKKIKGIAPGTKEVIKEMNIDKNRIYKVEAEDLAGNINSKDIEVNNIDKVNPTIEYSVNNEKPTNQNVEATLLLKDGESGIAKVILPNGDSLDIGYVKEHELKYVFTDNGSYEFVVKDRAGNTESKTIKISNIMRKSPSLDYKVGPMKNGSKKIKVAVTDYESKIDYFVMPNGEKCSGKKAVSLTVNESGDYKFKVFDIAGNGTEINIPVKIDNTEEESKGLFSKLFKK